MRTAESTPIRDARSLALETLGDQVLALESALNDAQYWVETWRRIALEVLAELHTVTAERDRSDGRTADVDGVAS